MTVKYKKAEFDDAARYVYEVATRKEKRSVKIDDYAARRKLKLEALYNQ
jgi:hypothetical protein